MGSKAIGGEVESQASFKFVCIRFDHSHHFTNVSAN